MLRFGNLSVAGLVTNASPEDLNAALEASSTIFRKLRYVQSQRSLEEPFRIFRRKLPNLARNLAIFRRSHIPNLGINFKDTYRTMHSTEDVMLCYRRVSVVLSVLLCTLSDRLWSVYFMHPLAKCHITNPQAV